MNKLCARAARHCPPPASHSAPTQAHCQARTSRWLRPSAGGSAPPTCTKPTGFVAPAYCRDYCTSFSELLFSFLRMRLPSNRSRLTRQRGGGEWRQPVPYGGRLAVPGPALGLGGRLPVPASGLLNRAAGRPEMTPSFSPEPPVTTRASRGQRSCAPS